MVSLEDLSRQASLDDVLASSSFGLPTVAEWLFEVLFSRQMNRSDVIRAARLNPTFGYQIFTGKRKGSRDKLLRIAFGLALGVGEADELLVLGGHAPLDGRSRRDVILAWSLAHGLSVDDCDDALWAHDEATLA